MITWVKYVSDNFGMKSELTRAIDQVKSEIPEPVDLTKYVAKNDDGSLTIATTFTNNSPSLIVNNPYYPDIRLCNEKELQCRAMDH